MGARRDPGNPSIRQAIETRVSPRKSGQGRKEADGGKLSVEISNVIQGGEELERVPRSKKTRSMSGE